MTTTIRTRIRTLTAAALVALAVVGVSAEHAHAKPKRPADNGVRCAIAGTEVGEPEDLVFYLPDDVISVRDINGEWRYYKCGADGRWVVIGLRPPPAGSRPAVPQPAVLAP
jgi:hypothetical protein